MILIGGIYKGNILKKNNNIFTFNVTDTLTHDSHRLEKYMEMMRCERSLKTKSAEKMYENYFKALKRILLF